MTCLESLKKYVPEKVVRPILKPQILSLDKEGDALQADREADRPLPCQSLHSTRATSS